MTINYALFNLNLAALRETGSARLSFFNEKIHRIHGGNLDISNGVSQCTQ